MHSFFNDEAFRKAIRTSEASVMLRATLIIKPLESWAVDISKTLGAPIRIVECTTGESGEVCGLVEFDLATTTRTAIEAELSRHPDVGDVHFSEVSDGRILGSLRVKKWQVCSVLNRPNCYVEGARTRAGGEVEWTVLVTDERTLNGLVRDLEDAECKVKLSRKRRIDDRRILTDRQRLVIEHALEMGYFDYPRRVTGRELARRLKISQSTLYETLQDSEKKIIEAFLLRSTFR